MEGVRIKVVGVRIQRCVIGTRNVTAAGVAAGIGFCNYLACLVKSIGRDRVGAVLEALLGNRSNVAARGTGRRAVVAVAEVEAEGGQVLGREITIENSAGRARVDLAYKDAAGNLVLGEAKNGPTAGLNANQQAVYTEFQKNGGRLVGGNAQKAGLPESVGPMHVQPGAGTCGLSWRVNE